MHGLLLSYNEQRFKDTNMKLGAKTNHLSKLVVRGHPLDQDTHRGNKQRRTKKIRKVVNFDAWV